MIQFYTGSLIGKQLFAKSKLSVYNSTAKGSAVAFTVASGGSVGTIKAIVNGYATNSGAQYFMVSQPNGKVYFVSLTAPVDTDSLIKQGALTLEQKAKDDADFNKKQDGGFAYYAEKWFLPITLGVGTIILGSTYVKAKVR